MPTSRLLAATALAALLLVPAATAAKPAKPTAITLSAEPERVQLVPLPCLPTSFDLAMTNGSDTALYADSFLTATEPIAPSRSVFSSYVPAGATVSTPVGVNAPRDTPPGDYRIHVTSGRAELDVPVTVAQAPPKGPGDNLALGEEATASSTHGSFDVCGAVDGDRDSENWNPGGWNDATRTRFPDTYDVALATTSTVSRVDLHTLDSAREPAARFGLRDWDVQVRVSGEWRTVDEVRANSVGVVSSEFAPVAADAVRIVGLASNNGDYSRIVELEVYGG